MSERYTVEYGEDRRSVWIRDSTDDSLCSPRWACKELNRLATQVETLRALLVEARRRIAYADDSDLGKRIDAALSCQLSSNP